MKALPFVNSGLALLAHSHIPLQYWDDALDTACYLINRLPSSVNPSKSPFELLFKKSPGFTLLRVFGCQCWPYLRPYNTHKMSFRSFSCVSLGYSKPHIGYKCLHIATGRAYFSHHVIFNEDHYSFLTSSVSAPTQSSSSIVLPPTLQLDNCRITRMHPPTAVPQTPTVATCFLGSFRFYCPSSCFS